MKNYIFIFSHQDDDFSVFELISRAIQNNQNVIIYYMTNGMIGKSIPKLKMFHRDIESLKVLKKLGVKKKEYNFFWKIK